MIFHPCFDTSDNQVVLENSRFSCLMYANYLVLLSTTVTGLQKCLDKLSSNCDANCSLSINDQLEKDQHCYI